MSNSASISAAKKRRSGGPPPIGGGSGQGQAMGMPPGLPPGLPPNFRQLPPHVQQQLFQQLQQRAAAAAAAAKSAPPMPPAPIQTRMPTPGPSNSNSNVNVANPYTVNTVIHNRAMTEVDGIHIRDLPISSAGLPCLPSGAALPPNVLFKLHHDELLNMDAILNEHSNKIQMLTNRVDRGAVGVSAGAANMVSENGSSDSSKTSGGGDFSYDKLVNNTVFITKILDNILTNTNLSDIINQIEPLQKENESLRALLNSQQTTLNELSGLVMKLLSNGMPSSSTIGNREYNRYDNTVIGGMSDVYIPNNEQYMGQNNGADYADYNPNSIDSGCTLSVTNLEEFVETVENGVLHEEDGDGEDDGDGEGDEGDEEGQGVDS
jgi:hypothetical protein